MLRTLFSQSVSTYLLMLPLRRSINNTRCFGEVERCRVEINKLHQQQQHPPISLPPEESGYEDNPLPLPQEMPSNSKSARKEKAGNLTDNTKPTSDDIIISHVTKRISSMGSRSQPSARPSPQNWFILSLMWR